jgi:drug/metabolite transporter (DMT)-like permease
MNGKSLIGIVLIIAGIALIVFGINHMNTAGAKIADFFGQEDKTGMFSVVAGVILALAGAFTSFSGRRA